MKILLVVLLVICDFANGTAATLLSETWNNVNGGRTFELENSDTSRKTYHYINIPGADESVIFKMEPGYGDSEISDQAALGSDGPALIKDDSLHTGKALFSLSQTLDLSTGKGWVTMTFDYGCEPRDSSNPGYLGPEFLSDSGETSFIFRPANSSTNPVISFFRNETFIFGTDEKVSSLASVGHYSPRIELCCVLAYNQTTLGMWDVYLGYSVNGETMKVTSRKNIPRSEFPIIDKVEMEYWKGSLFWMDNIKVDWNEGTYVPLVTASPVSSQALETK